MDSVFGISAFENPHKPNFIKIGQSFDFGNFEGYTLKKPKFLGKKRSDHNLDAIFEISSLENPYIPNFIGIGQDFNFGNFLGVPSLKKPKFFWPKKFGPKF